MCRLVAYYGPDILLADVLVKPIDSLVNQSLVAQETTVVTNGDGFGVGWYVPSISSDPAIFLSIFPAWNDENLLHLTAKIKSNLFFGHVRAASIGGVNNFNCHPFIYNNWMFMHNGQIANFLKIKRKLINLLDDDIYNWIRGETDSEHFFALFLQLAKGKDLSSLNNIAANLQQTFAVIENLLNEQNAEGPSFYNICLTNGSHIVASRYCTDETIPPETLYYLKGRYFWSKENYLQEHLLAPHPCVLVASERLTDYHKDWIAVEAGHMLLVDKDYSVQIMPIS